MDLSGAAKRTYHHGDLRNALIAAAGELAAEGGPDAVTVRAAARLAGVTPTAAYRHFSGQEELLGAAKECALEELTAAAQRELDARPHSADPVRHAMGALCAVGRGYLNFARERPGLFRTVFFWAGASGFDPTEHESTDPFSLLVQTLDELVSVGYLPVERRPMAEVAAWSMVHGLAVLLDGPLRGLADSARDDAITRTMLIFAHGLAGTALTDEQEAALVGELRRRPAHRRSAS